MAQSNDESNRAVLRLRVRAGSHDLRGVSVSPHPDPSPQERRAFGRALIIRPFLIVVASKRKDKAGTGTSAFEFSSRARALPL